MLSIGKQLTAEQRLDKAVVDIMDKLRYVALAGVLMIGEKRVKDNVPTACTNGRDEYYGRAFVDKLNDAELRFLVLHESYHKLYRHLKTWHHLWVKDAQIANMAMDEVINNQIVDENKDDGFATMTGELTKGCCDEKYRGWDTAQVFNDLYNKHRQQSQDQGDGGNGDGKSSGSSGGGGTPSSSSSGSGTGDNELPQPIDDHDWEGAQALTADEERELERDIDEAIRQGAMIAGKMGSGVNESIAELLKPQVDWKQVMRDFITSTCAGKDSSTYNRPNRRFIGAGVYMPSGISETVDCVTFDNDASGSNIGQREQSVVLTEGKSAIDLVKPDVVHVTYWDTKITRHEKYEGDDVLNFAESTRCVGGGGTNVECVPEFYRNKSIKPSASIVMTDGYLGGSWGVWNHPVLWVIIDNPTCKPPFGKCVHVKSRDLC